MNATYPNALPLPNRHAPPASRGPAGVRPGRRRRGLGVVELLVALAISASVLAAVAYAVDATFRAYSINQEQSDLMQKSRLALYRLVTTIRTTTDHAPVADIPKLDFEAGRIATDSGIQMYDAVDTKHVYTLDPARGEVTVEMTPKGGIPNKYVLLRGVRRFEIKLEPMRSQHSIRTGGVYDQMMRATFLLTIQTSGNAADVDERVAAQEVTLSTSVMPRRNAW